MLSICCMDDYTYCINSIIPCFIKLIKVGSNQGRYTCLLTKNDDWFDIKLLIYCKKGYDIKQCIQYETYQNKMKMLFKKLKILSTHYAHFGRGIGPIERELTQMEPQYINNLGNWKPYTEYECYSYHITIKITKVMSGSP